MKSLLDKFGAATKHIKISQNETKPIKKSYRLFLIQAITLDNYLIR